MNLFLGLLTDPFVAGRGDRRDCGRSAPQFAEESDAASAYASNGKARSKSERDAYAAVYRKAPLREPYDPRWSVWARGLWRLADHRRQYGAGIEQYAKQHRRRRRRRRLSVLATHHCRLRGCRRRHQLQRQRAGHRPFRPVPGRRVRASHRRPGLYLGGAGLWLAGRHHRPHRDHRRRRSVARQLQCQHLVGPRRGRLSFRRAVDGRRRHHALCGRTVHDLRSAGLCRAGALPAPIPLR